jgi:hypothetical protein
MKGLIIQSRNMAGSNNDNNSMKITEVTHIQSTSKETTMTTQKILVYREEKHLVRQYRICSVHKMDTQIQSFCEFCVVPLHKGPQFEVTP